MKYHKLGRTGIDVSVICLGTMTFGEQNTLKEAHQQLDYALDQGVNFIDTAELYAIPPRAETYGKTEEFIGKWLQGRGKRDDIILASKVCGPGADWLPHIREGQTHLDRHNITKAVDGSLKRLKTDYLDLYQLHWPERKTNFFGRLGYEHDPDDQPIPIIETLQLLNDLVQAGKVRHIGLSNETAWGVMRFVQLSDCMQMPRVVSIQNPYSLLNRSFEVGLAEVAHREDVRLLAYSPLGFGVLSGKYLEGAAPKGARLTNWPDYDRYSNPQALAATAEYVKLAHNHGLDPAQMALAYVNSRPFLTSTIIGATNMAQLKANIASIGLELGEELLQEIEAIHTRYPNPCP
ncbi:MAG: NADP(H)-dependent aldo-keto reductase [Gammaproteobacteria bacterium]|nr:NADP(H)-dependent aldo-keto reductase [Gammaproteobacteria bacterium]MCW8972958.1 NADP(H)-dependent aldo-keto reductase [Gammaproteobacteria bacterium]MCW8993714.1 NADP(H)-dependent aldo-keto reductase [Gammaproteobacteria bacterium]